MAIDLGMTLLHPWGLSLGIAAVGLPIAIHILTRPRPIRLPLSTVRFVRQAIQQKKARYRLRDFLVLLLRTSAVALLGWGFARPMIGAKPIVDPAMPGSVVRVILLDDSLSMGAASNNSTALDRARSTAARYLQYQPGLRADVIIAAAQSSPVFDKVSTNISALREAISGIAPLPQGLDAQAAINRASELLAKAPQAIGGRMELVIVSDFQRTNWASVDFSPVPKEAAIQLESVAPTQPPDNLAILRVGARGRLEQGQQVRLEVEIGNYSNTPRDIQAEMDLGTEAYHLQGLCPPRVKTTLSSMVTMPGAPGWLVGQAKLIGVTDALAADNNRPVALQVRALTGLCPDHQRIVPSASKFEPLSGARPRTG